MLDLDRMLDICRRCKYLAEGDLKQLCDVIKDILMSESNVQPVQSPVSGLERNITKSLK